MSARRMKRLFDIACAVTVGVLLAPLLAAIWLAMAIDMLRCRRDRGGWLYREPRISRGRSFGLLKFRTLRREALCAMEGGERHARLLEADPANLTWVGRRLLKPWYLDELPQVWNILRGEMSVVGPRPWPASMVERQVADGHDYRLHVTPGWTGPAQVSKGDSSASFTDLDLAYVALLEHGGSGEVLRRDLRLVRETLRTMVRGEGLRF